MEAPATPKKPVGKVRNPIVVILLSIVTLGIYGLVYMYSNFEELHLWRGQGWSGLTYILLALLLPPASIAVPFLLPAYVGRMYAEDGREKPVTGLTGCWCLLPIIGGFVWLFIVQGRLNDFWTSKGATA